MVIRNFENSITSIAEQLNLEGVDSEWYLFGSFLRNPKLAEDIDLLIVYQDENTTGQIRERLKELSTYFPLDLLLMTEEEEKSFDFIKTQNAHRLFPEITK